MSSIVSARNSFQVLAYLPTQPDMGSGFASVCRDLGKCARMQAGDGRTVVHFPSIPALWRALPPNPCICAISCKELSEVHGCLQGYGGSARRNGRPAGFLTCASLKSLHEMKPLQGIGRSARRGCVLPQGFPRSARHSLGGLQKKQGSARQGRVPPQGFPRCAQRGFGGLQGFPRSAQRSLDGLQENSRSARQGCGQLQGIGGSARLAVGKWQKCARALGLGPFSTFPHHPYTWKISCSDSGEMYAELQG